MDLKQEQLEKSLIDVKRAKWQKAEIIARREDYYKKAAKALIQKSDLPENLDREDFEQELINHARKKEKDLGQFHSLLFFKDTKLQKIAKKHEVIFPEVFSIHINRDGIIASFKYGEVLTPII